MMRPLFPDDLALAVAAFGESAVGARLLERRRTRGADEERAAAQPGRPGRDAVAAWIEQQREIIARNRRAEAP